MGFSGRPGRGGPRLSVREVAWVTKVIGDSKRNSESAGKHQGDVHGGPRISRMSSAQINLPTCSIVTARRASGLRFRQ